MTRYMCDAVTMDDRVMTVVKPAQDAPVEPRMGWNWDALDQEED